MTIVDCKSRVPIIQIDDERVSFVPNSVRVDKGSQTPTTPEELDKYDVTPLISRDKFERFPSIIIGKLLKTKKILVCLLNGLQQQ